MSIVLFSVGAFVMFLVGAMIVLKIIEVLDDISAYRKVDKLSIEEAIKEAIGWNDMMDNLEEMFSDKKDYITIKLMVDGEVAGEVRHFPVGQMLDWDRIEKHVNYLINSYNLIHSDKLEGFRYGSIPVNTEPISELIIIGEREESMNRKWYSVEIVVNGNTVDNVQWDFDWEENVEEALMREVDEYVNTLNRSDEGTYFFHKMEETGVQRLGIGSTQWRMFLTYIEPAKVEVKEKKSYYSEGGIECIDYLKAKLTLEEFRGFCKGNIIKYNTRAKHKGSEKEDIKKATDYQLWLNETYEK